MRLGARNDLIKGPRWVIADGSLRDRLEKPTMVRTIGQLQCNVREDEHRPTLQRLEHGSTVDEVDKMSINNDRTIGNTLTAIGVNTRR